MLCCDQYHEMKYQFSVLMNKQWKSTPLPFPPAANIS